jgi:8-oxo-dGTP diphosphatase
MNQSNRIVRYGAYGVALKDSRVLLTLKKNGAYKGSWDLPGGGIEFGESPEEALRREFVEETAMEVGIAELMTVATSNREYTDNNMPYSFHHIGIIYNVTIDKMLPDLIPEEEMCWQLLADIENIELTPITKQVLRANHAKKLDI